ncbi:DUF2339 domain-containing protein [Bacillus marinisedimentorum]|uniref:DUF2339 domain-containing protein n=1 Tax=Bacillus marinisedimentorum TaxID=1821260 RepID=UPI0007DEF208|nr:DUF2339 domain-containing protein [Bacillus marinisedimentorum]
MTNQEKIAELEKRVNSLQKETVDLKRTILEMKRDAIKEEKGGRSPVMTKAEGREEDIHGRQQEDLLKHKKDRIEREPIDWERMIGQVWLPRIFIFVLLIGVIWAFKAASDYGFINPPVKVGLGYLSAGGLLYLGHRQINKKRAALGQVLLSGSVVLLLISTFAMHALYGMVPAIPAFLLNLAWVGLGIFLSVRYSSEPLAILTAAGGYLIPFLLESREPSVTNFVVFETVFYTVLLLFAMKEKFTYLYFSAFGLFHLTLAAGVIFIAPVDNSIFGIAVIIQHAAILAAFLFIPFMKRRQLGTVFASFILTSAWVKLTLTDLQYEMVMLAALGVYAGLAVYFLQKDRVRLPAALSAATMALLFYLTNKFEAENILSVLIIQGLVAVFLGIKASSKLQQAVGALIYLISGTFIVNDPFREIWQIEFLNWLVLTGSTAGAYLLVSMVKGIEEESKKQVKQVVLGAALLLFMAFITLAIQALTAGATLNIQYMSVSIAWAIYALGVIIFGVFQNNKLVRMFGLILLFITLAKLVFFDLAYLSLAIRAFLFILLGLIGIAGSRIFYKSGIKQAK